MECGDLQEGFRLDEWFVEPQKLRITGAHACHSVEPALMRILLCLARRHGEVVDRQTLRECVSSDKNVSDDALRADLHKLRELLGDSTREPRYILAVPHRGYALVAHFEPLAGDAASTPGVGDAPGPVAASLVARIQHLAVELKRRHVLKVVGAYMIAIWVILQVAETTFEPLHFPGWWMTALTILAVIGVPVITSLAWSYEITPGGITLDPADQVHLHLPHARRSAAPLLVTGVALMAGVTGLAWWRSIVDREADSQSAMAPPARAIAVMPFADLTQVRGGAPVGDGLTEEISVNLAQLPGLRVVPPATAFQFRGRTFDAREIGRKLGVQHVLQGEVRRDGERLQVTAQLIKASSGARIWTESYDRRWRDVISVQEEITLAVAEALGVADQRAKRQDVGNLVAYDHYLAGVSAMRSSGDLSQMNVATDQFHKALEIDPGFARAYAGLCEAGVARYDRTLATQDVADAEVHCRKALALDPSRRETELALGGLYLSSGRHEQAEAVYRELLVRYPANADVHAGLGRALSGQGRAKDAELSFRRAIEVEPQYPGAYRALGAFLFQSGRPHEAETVFRKVAELTPQSASAFNNLGAAMMMQGELAEAAQAFGQSLEIEPTRSAHANLGNAYYFLGQFEDAVREYDAAQAVASLDHQVMGNLADALWMIRARHGEAARVYARAARLAEEALKVNSTDSTTWAQLAYYAGRAGDMGRSHRAQVRVEALEQDEMYVHYYTALLAADHDDPEGAAMAIERAERLGYPRKLLEADPVLKARLPRAAQDSPANGA